MVKQFVSIGYNFMSHRIFFRNPLFFPFPRHDPKASDRRTYMISGTR
jgi:hypothetical protein